jgi:ATP-dependent DNA helicase RecQ
LPDDLVKKLKTNERNIIIKAFLQTDFRTHGTQSPWLFQLDCAIALKAGEDLMCMVGCDAGKTLAMALPVTMLGEGKIALTIVPLKLLQQNHVHISFWRRLNSKVL